MRRRARHRLIGAAVLVVALGVIGFPLLVRHPAAPLPGRRADRDSRTADQVRSR